MKRRRATSARWPLVAGLLAVIVVAGGVTAYFTLRAHSSNAVDKWTYLGTATNASDQLGGASTMAVYACVDKSSSSWTVRAKAELAPHAASPGNYTLTLIIWPYKSLADSPGNHESPRSQVMTSTWSGAQVAMVQTPITATDSNFVQTMAASVGHGSKIFPAPLDGLPTAASLATC